MIKYILYIIFPTLNNLIYVTKSRFTLLEQNIQIKYYTTVWRPKLALVLCTCAQASNLGIDPDRTRAGSNKN